MLNNIQLNAGLETNQAKQGRYINVVLAAGEIIARIRLSSGEVMQTSLVSGMAFPVPQGFLSVSFSSGISQQIKVWLGDLPLTFTPETSRSVGSSSVESISTQVFSGEASEIIPAKIGRNKLSIMPSKDIFIGGVGVGVKNGIKIKANEVFNLSTQSSIYAFEVSGQYPPSHTSKVTPFDLSGAELVSGTNPVSGFVLSSDNLSAITMTSFGAFYLMRLSDWNEQAIIPTDNTKGAIVGYYLGDYKDDVVFTSRHNSNGAFWCKINKNTREFSAHNINTIGASRCEHFDFYGDSCVTVDGSNYLYYSDDSGVTWNKSALSTGLTGVTYGIQTNSEGRVYVAHSGAIAYTDDKGDNWSSVSAPAAISGEHAITIDKSNDKLFVSTVTGVYSTNDSGTTWVHELSIAGLTGVVSRLGTVFAVSDESVALKSDSENWLTYSLPNGKASRGAAISGAGFVFAGYASETLIIKGSTVSVGGVDVAVMAEVN